MSNFKPQVILDKGEIVDSWMCDVGEDGQLKSNGGVENIIELNGVKYSVITDVSQTKAYDFEGNANLVED